MEENVVSLCRTLIAIDSINPFQTTQLSNGETVIAGNEKEMLDFCEYLLQQSGFQTCRQDCGGGRQNLLAKKGEGSSAILLYGHVDTVEVKEGWSREEALRAEIGVRWVDGREEEVIYGLGSNDMKGGLAAMLCAACQVEPQGYQLKIALGCDEEFWSLGSYALVHQSDFLDNVAFILVPELGESTVKPKPGEILVTLGRCGRAEFVIDVPGTGGHGAEPHRTDRVNAITQAAKIAIHLESYSKTLPVYRAFADNDQQVQASALATRIEGGQGLLSIPDQTQLIVNRVLVPGETVDTAKQSLEHWLQKLRYDGILLPVTIGDVVYWPEVSIRSRPTPSLLPYQVDEHHPVIAKTLARIALHTPLQKGIGVSVADENRFGGEAHKPVVVLGPRGEDSHAAYEWVSTPSLILLEQLYLDILRHGHDIIQGE